VGFRVVEGLAGRLGVSLKKRLFRSYRIGEAMRNGFPVFLVEPLTYMNASGRIFPEILHTYGLSPDQILVVCDSLDLSPGNCRLRLRGSSAGHKGLESVSTRLGTEAFMRLLIGIGRPADKGDTVEYVLGRPEGEQAALVARGIQLAVEAVLMLLDSGPIVVMNEFNRRETPS
jgi:PTH1 family peptidyl-tRNA hydrolase